ncbi:MAG: UDP-glucose 4-epimerase GalE [Acidobacteriota bacterium]|nr:MAG: UDP-glucose 4-epimerase GalE [Acidobacteriota bacterium]
MKILVTGGCGYIGSATARWLHRRGVEVSVIDDLSEGHRRAWDGALAELDLLDRDACHRWLADQHFDGVIHFAARCYVGESVQQPVRYWRANVVPLIHLTEVLEGVPIVFSSSCATYGFPRTPTLAEDHPQQPVNPYGATKLAAERLLNDRDAAGLGRFAALRYFNAAGASADGRHGEHHDPETHLIPLAIRAALGQGSPLTVFGTDWDTPDGSCIRDYIHVDDLASAHYRALEHLLEGGESDVWNLGTGRGSSVIEVIETVGRLCGTPVPHEIGPRREGDPQTLVANADKARRDLGWEPAYRELAALVETAVRWHKQQPAGYA